MKEFFSHFDFNNVFELWGVFFGISLIGFFLLLAIKGIVVARLRHIVARTNVVIDDVLLIGLSELRKMFLCAASLVFAAHILPIPAKPKLIIDKLGVIILLVQLAISGRALISYWLDHYIKINGDDGGKIMTTRAFSFLAKLAFYSILLLWGLDNFGVNISALLTGLGVGGIAIALAVQNILSDLLASLTIVFDKPFVIGDAVIVGQEVGTIEYIGLKTTRLRSLSGEQLIFPNADLLQSRIKNFKRMTERRVVLNLGVIYQTPIEKLKAIPKVVAEVITSTQEKVRFERAHFKGFGPSSLDFEVIYWVEDPAYLYYMDVQQTVNYQVMEAFQKMGIEFAYPTQTIFAGDGSLPAKSKS